MNELYTLRRLAQIDEEIALSERHLAHLEISLRKPGPRDNINLLTKQTSRARQHLAYLQACRKRLLAKLP